MKLSYLLALSALVLFALGCKPKTTAAVEVAVADWTEVKQEITLSDEPVVLDEDTTIYATPPTTAEQQDAINYFRNNNRLKDWDPKKGKQIIVKAVIEKDGSLTRPHVSGYLEIDPATGERKRLESWKEDEFTREALRLIKEAHIKPASNERGEPIRSDWGNVVFFPPK